MYYLSQTKLKRETINKREADQKLTQKKQEDN